VEDVYSFQTQNVTCIGPSEYYYCEVRECLHAISIWDNGNTVWTAWNTWSIVKPIQVIVSTQIFMTQGLISVCFITDMSCRSRLAVLNEKLTTLERRVEYLEARVSIICRDQNIQLVGFW